LQIVNGIEKQANVVIYDLTGRKLFEVKDVSNNQYISGLEILNPGVFFVEITEGSSHFTTKMVKK